MWGDDLGDVDGVARWGWCCPSGPIPNVVVARTHAHGLAFARDADMRYYAGRVSGVRLAGLALVADQPLRSTRSIQPSALTRVLADRMAPKPQGWDVEHRCQTADTAALSTRPLDLSRRTEVSWCCTTWCYLTRQREGRLSSFPSHFHHPLARYLRATKTQAHTLDNDLTYVRQVVRLGVSARRDGSSAKTRKENGQNGNLRFHRGNPSRG